MNNRRLYKSSTDSKIAGVCGGIADYLGVDPTIIRIIAALLILGYGTGLVLYIIMAIIMPYDYEVK